MNRQHGYTLTETLVAMTLLIILSTAGYHGWQRWQQQQRLWQTAWQVRNFLFYLRNNANWHNRDRLLSLEKDGDRWCLYSAMPDARCVSGNPFALRAQWPEVTVAAITPGLGFYGLRNTAWPGHIQLRSIAGEWRVIVSERGRIRLCHLQAGAAC